MATASFDTARREGSAVPAIEKLPEAQVEAGPLLGMRASLVGLTREGLKAHLVAMGVPERESRMRTGQIWHWLYVRGAQDFDAMTNVGKGLKAEIFIE